jgi:hypothetical protein
MQIESTLLNLEGLTDNANGVKEMVLARLVEDKMITEDQSKIYAEKWQIIIIKTSWFKRWTSVFVKGDSSTWKYKYVKFEE